MRAFLRTLVYSGLGCGFIFSCTSNDFVVQGENDLIVPAGLRANLWAESPMFYNPTAMDVDHRGRIWVTEAVNYRSFKHDGTNPFHHTMGDRVVILEDSNGDGQADKSTVFVQDKDLQAPVGIAVVGNKVIVSSAPSLIVYTDLDGDDVPDKKEVFLTGFGGYDHDHSLHSIVVGPDGQWYFNTGNAGPHQVTDKAGWTLRSGSVYNGGTPFNNSNLPGLVSDDGRTWTGGLALKIQPNGEGLKVLAHNFRNAYELTMDSYGDMWQNDNDDQVTACRTSWLMEGSNAGYFSADGSRNWRADRRPDQSIFTAHWHQEDPGVLPAGDNSGAGAPTGVAMYESDLLGDEYRGMFLSADAGRNLVFGYRPQKKGAGFDMSDKITFATSVKQSTEDYRWNNIEADSSKSFRPSDVVVGSDGAVYIADWFDPIVGGHAMHDTLGYGRIYKINPENVNLKTPKINLESTKGQIQALLNPAINVRNMGFVKLVAQGESVIPEVQKIWKNDTNPYHQARAIYVMVHLGEKGKKEVESLLKSENNSHRLVAFRALSRSGTQNLKYIQSLSKDKDSAIRREVAIALRDYKYEDSREILLDLVDSYTSGDAWNLDALGIGFENKEELIYSVLVAKMGDNSVEWKSEMVDLVWRLHPTAAVKDVEKRILSDQLSIEQRKKALTTLAFIPSVEAALAMYGLQNKVVNKEVKKWILWWLEFRSTNDWIGYYEIEKSIKKVNPEASAWRKQLIAKSTILKEKIELIQTMAKDSDGGKMLIELAAENLITGQLRDSTSRYIFSNPDPAVRVMASEYFVPVGSDKVFNILQILQLEGDDNRGIEIFKRACQSCHKVGQLGAEVGPELTEIKYKMDKKTVCDAIVYPGADIVFGYEPWMIKMKDGPTHYGFIQSEGEYISMKDAGGNVFTIKKSEISSRERGQSLMPSPQALQLTEQDIADVVSYLWSIP